MSRMLEEYFTNQIRTIQYRETVEKLKCYSDNNVII